MIETASNNQISGKEVSVKDKDGKIIDYERFCSNCNVALTEADFFCEKTYYSSTLWFLCPKCNRHIHFVY